MKGRRETALFSTDQTSLWDENNNDEGQSYGDYTRNTRNPLLGLLRAYRVSIILYVAPRLMSGKWNWMDYLRVALVDKADKKTP